MREDTRQLFEWISESIYLDRIHSVLYCDPIGIEGSSCYSKLFGPGKAPLLKCSRDTLSRSVLETTPSYFDLVWCSDVLEYLSEETIDRCLGNLSKTCSGIAAISISSRQEETPQRPRQQDWWISKVSNFFYLSTSQIIDGRILLLGSPRRPPLPPGSAVVGNAASEVGSRNGVAIDNHETVARFNNFKITEDYRSDYGEETSVWITSLYRDIEDRDSSLFDRILVPLPYFSRGYQYRFRERPGGVIHVIPEALFRDLTTLVQRPSTGLSLLFWLYQTHGSLDNIDLFGFDFFRSRHYFPSEAVNNQHKGEVEENLIQRMIEKTL